MIEAEKKAAIRLANDTLRKTFFTGSVVNTPGFGALPTLLQQRLVVAIKECTRFEADEHDRGRVKVDGVTACFNITAFDTTMEWASPDPSDPAVTRRVMTLYLPHED